MKYNLRKKPYNYKFDFEIGYLVKSPCRKCSRRKKFPQCVDECDTLDKIHTLLAETVSCAKHRY